MAAIQPGERAPDFTLPAHDGRDITLSTLLQKSAVVLFFYPKDDTPGCTKEACSFRDTFEDFTALGATVVGISSDPPDSHRRFVDKYHLPFILVSDTGGSVRTAYRVPKTLFIRPGRTTFVIDRNGIVRMAFTHARNAERHVREALAVVRQGL
ncbi:MAG: peroxiredoxin [Deltaproteobacteria bacterium]|nr:peroxiredoxin [Deltaproteobacteria bacterium]